ncbi:MAG: ABC transporter ATP-binding protein [Desulfurococcaceae archaeon]
MKKPLMITRNLSKYFGGIKALEEVSITIFEEQIVGLIGPNGSGKTTLFNVITGFYMPDKGEILYRVENKDLIKINGLNPHEVFKLGIVRTFQIPRLFPSLTVLENLLIAPPNQIGEKILNAVRRKMWLKEEENLVKKAIDLLTSFGKQDIIFKYPLELSVADVKLIETLRGLMTPAKIYLLDEPLAGLDLPTARSLLSFIKELRDRYKLTFFVIEHRIDLLMEAVDHVYVLHNGRLLASGKPSEVMNNPDVIKAYVGG